MNLLYDSIVIGAGATAVMDLWATARTRLLDVPAPDYGLVGRWIGHLARGRFRHDAIRRSPPVRGEAAIGWTAHYAIGMGFAGALLAIAGGPWTRDPTPGPALAFGVATVLAPFLVLQPGMGAGIAARRTPRPWAARAQSLVTHAVFGLGLYSSALLLNLLKG